MPRVNPNADDNDPLWPKAFKWPGGRALAPQRKTAPPLPRGLEEEPPNEKFPWIVDPANRPAAPPEGDVQTGEKTGPAYTKAPRDVQRSWVNAAFSDMVRKPETAFTTARALEGSVFDTPDYASVRGLSSGDVPAGVIVPRNIVRGFTKPELAAQALWQRMNPKLFNAFKNDARPGGEYMLDLTQSAGQKGYTMRPKQPGSPIAVRINPKLAGPETYPHEADHAFAFRRQPRGPGSPMKTGGFNVLEPEVREAYMHMAGGDPFHAATYYRADEAAKRTGRSATSGRSLLKSVFGTEPHAPGN